MRGAGARQDRQDGGFRSAAGYLHHLRRAGAASGKQYPLSAEKLSPVLSLYFVKDFNAALDTCFALLKFGGMGHTAVIHSKNDAAHAGIRHAHAGHAGAGEYARAARLHRHHHQCLSRR